MRRRLALLGIAGPLTAYVAISLSVYLSGWFSWSKNALSDLGHSVKSAVAPIYNLGLLLAGFLMALFSVGVLVDRVRRTGYCLLASSLLLQLVAVFDEVYGPLHFYVSLLFFLSLGVATAVYAVEAKSRLALASLLIGILSWILYWAGVYRAGVAVPELTTSTAALAWVLKAAVKEAQET